MIVVIINKEKKLISSKQAMRMTVQTSPFYPAWVKSAQTDIERMMIAIKKHDFREVGEITQSNALRMHASMMTAVPPIIYWQPETLSILQAIENLREKGFECYATMDAGPNVKILTRQSQAKAIVDNLLSLVDSANMIICLPGEGAQILDEN
jgi:diphosphomevalonate decarboxylase